MLEQHRARPYIENLGNDARTRALGEAMSSTIDPDLRASVETASGLFLALGLLLEQPLSDANREHFKQKCMKQHEALLRALG